MKQAPSIMNEGITENCNMGRVLEGHSNCLGVTEVVHIFLWTKIYFLLFPVFFEDTDFLALLVSKQFRIKRGRGAVMGKMKS